VEGDIVENDDDSWLDDIALLTLIPDHKFPPFPITSKTTKNPTLHHTNNLHIPTIYSARLTQETTLHDIQQFLTTLQSPIIKDIQAKCRFIAKAMEFFINDEKLFKKNGKKPPLLVIFDGSQKQSILLHAHENLGHRGIQTVYEVVCNHFYWPHMRADIYHYVQSCHECQIQSLKRLEVPLTISAPVHLFAKIYIDIMHMPIVNNYKYIVATKDDLSGTCEAQPLCVTSVKNLADFFWNYIYCQYGAPLRVVTDNGPEVKEAFDKLLKRMSIPQI
jgi:hypothetical protein